MRRYAELEVFYNMDISDKEFDGSIAAKSEDDKDVAGAPKSDVADNTDNSTAEPAPSITDNADAGAPDRPQDSKQVDNDNDEQNADAEPITDKQTEDTESAVEEQASDESEAEITESVDTQSTESDEGSETPISGEEYENETFDFGLSDSEEDEKPDTDEVAAPANKKQTTDKYDPDNPRRADTRFDIVEIFTFTLVAIILITSFLFRHSIVEGGSMLNTLTEGDHLILTDVFYTPKRYDIVVFEDYSTGFNKALIKRVIATEGEVVKINEDGEVFVNGERIRDDFVYRCHDRRERAFEYTVGEGEVFVMGDHRCCSTDSRNFGAISESSILGKVILRFYPFSFFGAVN